METSGGVESVEELGVVWYKQDRYDDAERQLERTLESQREYLGPANFNTLSIERELTECLRERIRSGPQGLWASQDVFAMLLGTWSWLFRVSRAVGLLT